MPSQIVKKCKSSADAAVHWLLRRLQDDGSYGPGINDLACFYKSPYLFYISGEIGAARRTLRYIERSFMQKNGDFKTSEAIKSANGAFVEYWAYTNGWIALAAQKMGCFDIAYPAYRYLQSFYHAKNGGFTTLGPYREANNTVDVLTTAHLGLTALYFGEIEKAIRAGKLLQLCFAVQPDVSSGFYLRMNDTGDLITDYAEDTAIFHHVSVLQPNQAYFMIGYPIAFLAKLFLATENTAYLDTASRYLDFAMCCHESIVSFHFSHKVAWGAAIVAGLTRKAEYFNFSKSIVEYLLSIQDGSGGWLQDQPPDISFDQTAEIAIWLREIGSEIP